jgi:hypothetical protein
MPLTKVPLTGLADDVQTKMNVTNTLSGTSGAAQFRSNRTAENARNTGFQLANGTDIGETDRTTQYYDDHVNNCNGYVPNNNCRGDLRYRPPNGNWWTWGSPFPSGNCANSGSYDGAGGFTQSFNAVSVNYTYDAYYEAANEIGGSEQRRNFRNCNCGSFNCRTNCNCNCDCNCGNG